jgi:hypothetical protein
MNKLFVTASLAATLTQPAAAITFPSLTTIYIGAGVKDNGGATNEGIATTFLCTNVSGTSATIRYLVLHAAGNIAGQTSAIVAHGATSTVSTHLTSVFPENSLATGSVEQGAVNIESTQSGVFCTAQMVDALGFPPAFMSPVHLVRVNPHPGTVE